MTDVLNALRHPTRRAIIRQLANGPARFLDVAKPFDTALNAVTEHLKLLESLITKTGLGPDRKKQGCHEARVRDGAAVIPPWGKLYADATMVLSSPFESLVLEAVLTVIGGASAQAVPTPFSPDFSP